MGAFSDAFDKVAKLSVIALNPEAVNAMTQLLEQVFQLRIELLRCYEKIDSLEKENIQLKAQLHDKLEVSVTRDDERPYLRIAGRGNAIFCVNCWDLNHELVQMSEPSLGVYVCPKCGTQFTII